MKSPLAIRNLTVKLAIAFALVATPLAVLGLGSFEPEFTTVAGSNLPTDVDPG